MFPAQAGGSLVLLGAKCARLFESALGAIQPVPLPIVLKPGDALQLTRADTPGEPAELDEADNSIIPAHIACAQPAAGLYCAPTSPDVGSTVALPREGMLCTFLAQVSWDSRLERN